MSPIDTIFVMTRLDDPLDTIMGETLPVISTQTLTKMAAFEEVLGSEDSNEGSSLSLVEISYWVSNMIVARHLELGLVVEVPIGEDLFLSPSPKALEMEPRELRELIIKDWPLLETILRMELSGGLRRFSDRRRPS